MSALHSQSVPLKRSLRSTRFISVAAASSVSHRTARTSSVLSQFHAAHTARIFASMRLMIALTYANATPQSAVTSVNGPCPEVTIACVIDTDCCCPVQKCIPVTTTLHTTGTHTTSVYTKPTPYIWTDPTKTPPCTSDTDCLLYWCKREK